MFTRAGERWCYATGTDEAWHGCHREGRGQQKAKGTVGATEMDEGWCGRYRDWDDDGAL